MNAKRLLLLLLLPAVIGIACWLPVLATPGPDATPAVTLTPITVPDTGSPTAGQTSTPSPSDTVKVFLVKLEDRGQAGTPIGCDDSLVALDTATQTGEDPLISAYSALFAIREERVGPQGLYNALHASNLILQSSEVDAQGRAEIRLVGNYTLGGVCDTPRFIAQLEAAALQFPNVQSAQIFLNDVPIEEALSNR